MKNLNKFVTGLSTTLVSLTAFGIGATLFMNHLHNHAMSINKLTINQSTNHGNFQSVPAFDVNTITDDWKQINAITNCAASTYFYTPWNFEVAKDAYAISFTLINSTNFINTFGCDHPVNYGIAVQQKVLEPDLKLGLVTHNEYGAPIISQLHMYNNTITDVGYYDKTVKAYAIAPTSASDGTKNSVFSWDIGWFGPSFAVGESFKFKFSLNLCRGDINHPTPVNIFNALYVSASSKPANPLCVSLDTGCFFQYSISFIGADSGNHSATTNWTVNGKDTAINDQLCSQNSQQTKNIVGAKVLNNDDHAVTGEDWLWMDSISQMLTRYSYSTSQQNNVDIYTFDFTDVWRYIGIDGTPLGKELTEDYLDDYTLQFISTNVGELLPKVVYDDSGKFLFSVPNQKFVGNMEWFNDDGQEIYAYNTLLVQ
ncbi:MAG: hypothetical protein LBD63_00025 [Mycoplasmataceae bacterium]|nr:hypothetical protein [Mycoplasmataceae bacterium]